MPSLIVARKDAGDLCRGGAFIRVFNCPIISWPGFMPLNCQFQTRPLRSSGWTGVAARVVNTAAMAAPMFGGAKGGDICRTFAGRATLCVDVLPYEFV